MDRPLRKRSFEIIASQPPEVLFAVRLSEVRDAWFTLLWAPYMPQSWFAFFGALDRLEAERLRAMRGR
jgi:hypothetical protein